MKSQKPLLSFSQILNMNFGFFGLQYSFGLQQANMSPIYSYLGAEDKTLPLLWLAGPVTGLIVQPIIGAMSDKTVTRWGRRTPYFLIGAIICSICLFLMPYSSTLWMAASLLWILDAANNVTMEPYRAFVSDKLQKDQHSIGYLTQSAFTGLGQTLAYLTPSLLIWFGLVGQSATAGNKIPLTTYIAFIVGAVISITSILWTLYTTKEIPLTEDEKQRILNSPRGFTATFKDIFQAFKEMPLPMRQMIPMMLFSWYGLFTYWMYIAKCLAKSLYGATEVVDPGYRNAELLVGQIGAFYNFIAFFSAFVLVYFARRFGARNIHSLCLALAGIGLIAIPYISTPGMIFIPMVGLGLCWASTMGNTYVMLAGAIPAERTGVYMGIFNMFIVIPMFIQTLTVPLYYESWLGNDPTNAIKLAGALLIAGGISVLFVKINPVARGTTTDSTPD